MPGDCKTFGNFVRPLDQKDLWGDFQTSKNESLSKRRNRQNDEIKTGDDARAFYESLLVSDGQGESQNYGKEDDYEPRDTILSSVNAKKTNDAEKKSQVINKEDKSRLGNELLKFTQNGDIHNVNCLIERGVDINFQDSFGWTALMSASCGGLPELVKSLLINGANPSICDKSGKNAMQLAKQNGHMRIEKILMQHKCQKHRISFPETSHSTKDSDSDQFYCSVCKSKFKSSSEKQHATSTLHLFNQKLKPQSTSYFIPESNRGFQMMVKSGWDIEKGLGSEGQGRKFPVKTVLKRDRQGLGLEKNEKVKAKVTHFSAKDEKAVKKPKIERKMRNATISKKKRMKKERKDKTWERNLRIYMNS